MKNRWVRWVVGLLAGSLLIAPIPHHEAEAAALPTNALSINGASVESGQLEVRAGKAYLTLERLSELLGFLVDYESTTQQLTLIRPNTHLQMKLEDHEVEINGQRIKSPAAFADRGEVFVPLQVLSTALNTKTGWDAVTGSITLEDPERYQLQTAGKQATWVSFASGEIYSLESGVPKKLQNADVSKLEAGNLEVQALGGNAYLLTVEQRDDAAEQLEHRRFQFLVKAGVVERQAYFHYAGKTVHSQQPPAQPSAQRTYLTDGQKIEVIGAGGSRATEYHLEELTGQKGPFIVESVTANHLLVRAFDTLELTVVDL